MQKTMHSSLIFITATICTCVHVYTYKKQASKPKAKYICMYMHMQQTQTSITHIPNNYYGHTYICSKNPRQQRTLQENMVHVDNMQ